MKKKKGWVERRILNPIVRRLAAVTSGQEKKLEKHIDKVKSELLEEIRKLAEG